jgi:hypothetical protein
VNFNCKVPIIFEETPFGKNIVQETDMKNLSDESLKIEFYAFKNPLLHHDNVYEWSLLQ